MTRKSNRPRHFWYHPKPVNDIEKICDAVVEAVYDLEGGSWNGNKDQNNFQQAIVDADIFLSAAGMSGRNWMSIMSHFGLVYARYVTPTGKGRKKKITITPVGKQLKDANQAEIKKIIRYQLEKMQYRNATIRSVPEDMLLNPLYVVLKIIKSTKTLTLEEMACFVMAVQNHSGIPTAINVIKKYRNDRKTPSFSIFKGEKYFFTLETEKILRDYATRFLRHDFTWAEYLTESELKSSAKNFGGIKKRYSYKINTVKEEEIDKFLSKEPILDPELGITKGPYKKRNWNAWFEYYGGKKKPHRIVKIGVVTKEVHRAKKLIKIIDADESEITIDGKKISLKKLKQQGFDFNSLVEILHSTNARNKYSEIGRMSIEGNYLVEHPKYKKERIKLSDKVKRFEQIRLSAEFSDNSAQFERDVACVMAQFNVQSIWHGVRSSGKSIEDIEVLGGDTKNERFAILLDAKSRKKTFSIDTKDRRAMREYFENHQSGTKMVKRMWRMSKNCKPQKIPFNSHRNFECKALVFVSSNFKGKVKTGLGDLKKKTKCDCSCIRAEELLYLLDKHLKNPGKLTNDKLLKLFQRNGEILKDHINKLF